MGKRQISAILLDATASSKAMLVCYKKVKEKFQFHNKANRRSRQADTSAIYGVTFHPNGLS